MSKDTVSAWDPVAANNEDVGGVELRENQMYGRDVNNAIRTMMAQIASTTDWRREKLTANRTYYVRTDGSDSNTGLVDSAGGAFLTIQKAIDTVAGLDTSVYDITIDLGNGTYTATNILKSPLGAGKVTFLGDTTTPANVVISTTSANGFTGTFQSTRFAFEGITFQTTTSGSALNLTQTYAEINAVAFGACATAHCWLESNAYLTATGNYSITGGSTRHWFATNGGVINIASKTITITGTPAFSTAFLVASRTAAVVANANTFSGSATGTRYIISYNSVVDVAGAASTYLPGNAVGTTVSGGQYA